jgi:group I intron endonuclease
MATAPQIMLIYKITNLISGKEYIGQAISHTHMSRRWHYHRQFGLLGKAIRKYGLENFTFEVLLDNVKDHGTLDLLEKRLIRVRNTTIPDGYNVTFGGWGGLSGDRHWSKFHPERYPRGDKHYSRTHPEKLARGDRNGSRVHPERLARGDKHGSHTHPERIARGERANSKIVRKQVFQIRAMKDKLFLTNEEIAGLVGLAKSTIRQIVTRATWGWLP